MENNRIDKLEDRVSTLEDSYNTINVRTTILENSLMKIDKNIDAIFTEIKEIRKLREDDHFIKPLDKTEKLKSQFLGVLIGFFVAAFLTYIFPQIGG